MVMLNTATGQTYPARCGRNGCDYCLPRNAWRRAAAVALTRPERTITLTLVAGADDEDPWAVVRPRVKAVRYLLKQRAGVDPGEWAWWVERNPAGTGHHVHIAQWGPYVSLRELRRAARTAGCGEWVHVSAVDNPVNLAAYGLKGLGLADYGVKGFDREHEDAARREALRINGGRVSHNTRRYWRDAHGGQAVKGARGAERLALRMILGADEHGAAWTLVSAEAGESWPLIVGQASRRARAGRPMAEHLAETEYARRTLQILREKGRIK